MEFPGNRPLAYYRLVYNLAVKLLVQNFSRICQLAQLDLAVCGSQIVRSKLVHEGITLQKCTGDSASSRIVPLLFGGVQVWATRAVLVRRLFGVGDQAAADPSTSDG